VTLEGEFFAFYPSKVMKALGGVLHGTEYSLGDACPFCGTGAMQIGPLKLRSPKFPRASVFSTGDMEVLFSAKIASKLESECGCSFFPVLDAKKSVVFPDVKQLRPCAVLPPFSSLSTGVEREGGCPECRRDGFFRIPHSPLSLVYSTQSKQLFNKPVLATWERFGYSRVRKPFKDSVFAHGKFIISKEVAQILSDLCSSDFFLDPVTFSD